MGIIDKWLSKLWIRNFLIIFVALFVIALSGDLVNNLLRNKYTLTQTILNFLYNSPMIVSRILPISGLLASLFVINNLKTHSELIAIFSGGYPLKRYTSVFLLAGLAVMIIQFGLLGFIEPALQRKKMSALLDGSVPDNNSYSLLVRDRIWYRSQNYFSSFSYFEKETGKIMNPHFYFFGDRHRLTKTIKADYAYFKDDNFWELTDGVIIDGLSTPQFPTTKKFKKHFLELTEGPNEVTKFQTGIYGLDFFSLNRFLNQVDKSGLTILEYRIHFYNIIALSFACLLFCFYPLVSLKELSSRRANFGKTILKGLVFTIGFWIVFSAGGALAGSRTLPVPIGILGVPLLLISYVGRKILNLKELN